MLRLAQKKSVIYAMAGALFAAAGYFAITTHQVVRAERTAQQHLIDITNAFTKAYTEERSGDSVVPATFRRIGMDHFTSGENQSTNSSDVAAIMRMPGMPGLELQTIEADPRIRDYISGLSSTDEGESIEEFRWEDGQLITRTLVPSIAHSPSCVACHNAELSSEVYAVGNVMGAFVVETDLTTAIIRNAFFAVGAFLLVMTGALLLANREKNQMKSVVHALKGQVEAESYANFLASHDALTKLANRKIFRERLDKEVENVRRYKQQTVTALFVDIDDFKITNDTLGHDAGDAVLKTVAKRLSKIMGDYGGMAARLGGDEFAAFTSTTDTGFDADKLGMQLVEALSAELVHNGNRIKPGVSIGIACLSKLDNPDGSQLMKAADVALYAAKRRGKLCYHLFDDDLRAQIGRRSELASALPDAISNGQVYAILQPQIDIRTGAVFGFEGLARWKHKGEQISPVEFIPIAEEAGLISKLDIAILRQAVNLMQRLMVRSERHFQLSINVSTVDLRSDSIVEDISDALLSCGFDPHLLTVEITESAFLSDWTSVNRRLEQLRKMGIKIALDDFGTGYSSLSYLTQFSFDTIKVDRTFLQDIDKDTDRAKLLAHIVSLATSLNKTVVAEGIERQDQAEYVASLGAQIAQGALYGLDIEAAPSLLADLYSNDRLSA